MKAIHDLELLVAADIVTGEPQATTTDNTPPPFLPSCIQLTKAGKLLAKGSVIFFTTSAIVLFDSNTGAVTRVSTKDTTVEMIDGLFISPNAGSFKMDPKLRDREKWNKSRMQVSPHTTADSKYQLHFYLDASGGADKNFYVKIDLLKRMQINLFGAGNSCSIHDFLENF